MPLRVAKTVEGTTTLLVPVESLVRREPGTNPVFFNPAAKTNRDISVAITSAAGSGSFCDALSGIGARGVRIAKECPGRMELTLNDFNPLALRLAKRNARVNSVFSKCRFSHCEADQFLYSKFGSDEKFEFIDIDPFGTPAPYMQAAFMACADGGMLSITATDTAVLAGVYPKVSLRRYGSLSSRGEFEHETGLRILLYFCARMASINDIGIDPVAVHSTRHYMRIYTRVRRSATAAERSARSFGYVASCTGCGEKTVSEIERRICEFCKARLRPSGPLWVGKVIDHRILSVAIDEAVRRGLAEARRTLESLTGVDSYPPFSYDLEDISSGLRIPSVSTYRVIEELASRGLGSMRQPFEKTGLKTKATYREIVESVKNVSASVSKTDYVNL